MPPPCTDDWNAVKNTAVALNSIKEAAELHNVPYEAARMRASREKWPVGHRTAKAIANAVQVNRKQIAKANPNAVTAVTTTSDALISRLKEHGENTKQNLAEVAENASKVLLKKKGNALLKQHQAFKNFVSGSGQLHGWDEGKGSTGPTLNVLSIGGDMHISSLGGNERNERAT
jgi:formiminotetrahydrofolate cyclodeaminase